MTARLRTRTVIAGKTARELRGERRREDILAASERIFAAKGYHATGIADIADALGLGHGTFYRYFKNKHDIALAVLDRLFVRVAAIALAEDARSARTLAEYRAQSQRIMNGWLSLVDEHPDLVKFWHEQISVVDHARLERFVESYVVFNAKFLANGVERGFLRADLDVRATSEIVVAMIFEGTRRALAGLNQAARRRWAEAGLALIFDGIRRTARGTVAHEDAASLPEVQPRRGHLRPGARGRA